VCVSVSSLLLGSGVALGDLIAFDAATIDKGRLLTLPIVPEPRDNGRCCHDSVPDLEREEGEGGAGFAGSNVEGLNEGASDNSLRGGEDIIGFAGSGVAIIDRGAELAKLVGDSFLGEIDLARSAS